MAVTAARTQSAEPIVKWPGGKTRLLPELLARLPARWNRYYEPFAGGAALFFRLAPRDAVLGDLNADLIAMYRGVSTGLPAVQRHLRRYRTGRGHAPDPGPKPPSVREVTSWRMTHPEHLRDEDAFMPRGVKQFDGRECLGVRRMPLVAEPQQDIRVDQKFQSPRPA